MSEILEAPMVIKVCVFIETIYNRVIYVFYHKKGVGDRTFVSIDDSSLRAQYQYAHYGCGRLR